MDFDLAAVFTEAANAPTPAAAALVYAAAGLAVFPCNPETKAPLVNGGFKSATTAPDTVRDWWERHPAAMIGGPTGILFDVLDVDGTEGIEALQAMTPPAMLSDMEERARTVTPRGGFHIYLPPVKGLKTAAPALGANVDTRAGGGYAILPGSSRADGALYTFKPGTFTEAPAWLLNRFSKHGLYKDTRPTARAPRAAMVPVNYPPGIPPSVRDLIEAGTAEGQRNVTAFRIACQLRDEHLSETETAALVRTFAARCTPPLPDTEANRATASAYTTAPREPARNPTRTAGGKLVPVNIVATVPPSSAPEGWEADPVPLGGFHTTPAAFPVEGLPGAVGAMVQAVRDTYRAPVDLIAACALGVLSIATRNRFKIEMKRDHRTHTNLYFMGALPPGEKKTPVLKAFSAPLEAWQREARPAWEQALKDWQRRAGNVEAKTKGIRKQLERPESKALDMIEADKRIADLESELGPPPPAPCAFTTDATSEALSRIMSGNRGCAAVMTSEGRKMLSVAKGRYVEGGDVDLWLAGHAGDFCRIDRRGSEPVEIAHPTLAALVLTQPDSLQELGALPSMRESGFLARWLYVCPDASAAPYNVESVPEAIASAWSNLVRRIMDYAPALGADGEPLPHLLKMTAEALAVWVRFHDDTAARMHAERETTPPILQTWESKLPEHVARLAGLVRIIHHIEAGEPLHTVTASDVETALSFVPALRTHAARAVDCMGADVEKSRARKVWDWIQKNRDTLRNARERENLGPVEAVKPRDIERAGVAGIGKATEAAAVLDLLTEKGWLQAVTFKREGTTGKPQAIYFIRPQG